MVTKNCTYIQTLETELAAQRAYLHALRTVLPVGVCTVNARGAVLSLNASAEQMFGWSEAACRGKSLHRLIHCHLEHDGFAQASCPVAQMLRSGETLQAARVLMRNRDGASHLVEVRGQVVRQEAILSFCDLTEQLSAQHGVTKLLHILEENPEPIVELNHLGQLTYANAAMLTLLEQHGFTAAGWPTVLPESIEPLIQHCLQSGKVMKRVTVIDNVKRYHWTFFPVPHTKLVRGYGEDVTVQQRKERRLQRAKAAAEEENRAKTELLGTMSHELRTPLGVVLGYTSLLLDGAFGELLPRQADVIRRVDTNARDLLELVSAVLDVNRLEAGRLPIEIKEVQIPDFLRAVSAETQGVQDQSSLAFTWRVANDLPPVRTDPGKLKIVLKNLINNAVKFTSQGSVAVAARRSKNAVEISVTDTGNGIPHESLARIFEPFLQVEGSQPRCYGSTGLGLYIVKRMLAMLGGEIKVESTVGKGSTFRVRVPC